MEKWTVSTLVIRLVAWAWRRQGQAKRSRDLRRSSPPLDCLSWRLFVIVTLFLGSLCSGQAQLDPLVTLGIQQRRAGDYTRSIETLQKAVDLAHKSGNLEGEFQAKRFLSLTYGVMGDLRKTAALGEECLVFVRQHRAVFINPPMNRETDLLGWLGGIYSSLGEHKTALAYLKQSLAAEAADDPKGIGLGRPKALYKLGIAQLLGGDTAQAQKTLQESYQAFEDTKKARLEGRITQEYEIEVLRWLEELAVMQGKTNEALGLAQRSRAGNLALLLLSRQDRSSIAPVGDAPAEESARQLARQERSTLVEYSVTYQFDPLVPLEFSNYEMIRARHVFIWVVKPTGQIAFRQVDFGKSGLGLAELVRDTRASIGVRGRGVTPSPGPDGKQRLQQLYHLLIQPIENLLPADPKARVIVIPQDLLYLVPFAALQDEAGRYLIEKHTLSTEISMSVLRLSQERFKNLGNSGKGILVVGNPAMPTIPLEAGEGGGKLPALPGAEKEARQIAKIFSAHTLIGERATKNDVLERMPHARMLHFATHGLLVGDDALLSSLAFAPSGQDNGFLQAREIHGLKLNAELAVLSACDTAKGKITGDGVVGLARSFIEAGVPSVVVSLWSVEDDATAALMTAFYRQLQNGSDKAQALRSAMLSTMKDYHEPRAWAAFTLLGVADSANALATVRGDSPLVRGPVNDARYFATFPLPEGIKDYRESPDFRFPDQMQSSYSTGLSVTAVMAFYRQALSKAELHEDAQLTHLEARGFSLVFQGKWKDRVLNISCSDEGGTRFVSLTFERRP